MRDALSVPLEKTVAFPPHPLRCAQHLLGKEKAARTPTAPAGRKLRTRIASPVPPEELPAHRKAKSTVSQSGDGAFAVQKFRFHEPLPVEGTGAVTSVRVTPLEKVRLLRMVEKSLDMLR